MKFSLFISQASMAETHKFRGPGMPRLGEQRGSCPLCPLPGGHERQEVSFILNFFHVSYLVKGYFPALQIV